MAESIGDVDAKQEGSNIDQAPRAKRTKRTYRACIPCRSRKLKCDLGDPDAPSEGPCKRCRRESRDCVFSTRNARTYNQSSSSSSTPIKGADLPSAPVHPAYTPAGYSDQGSAGTSVPRQLPPPPWLDSALADAYSPNNPALTRPLPTPAFHASSLANAHFFPPPPPPGPPLLHQQRQQQQPQPLTGQSLMQQIQHQHQQQSLGASHLHRATQQPSTHMQSHPSSQSHSLSSSQLHTQNTSYPLASSDKISHVAKRPPPDSGPEQRPESEEENDELDGEEDDDDVDDDEDDRQRESNSGSNRSESRRRTRRARTVSGSGRGSRGEASGSGNVIKAKGPRDSDILLSSTLHNPSDALRLLATASSLRQSAPDSTRGTTVGGSPSGVSSSNMVNGSTADSTPCGGSGNQEATGWAAFTPIPNCLITQPEAEVLFSFFETDMSPLYPLLPPEIFSAAHLPVLTTTESLLLCAMITIAARYSSVLPRARSDTIHVHCANYIRQELIYLHEGSPAARQIASVEALLLLTEWPSIPLVHVTAGGVRDRADEPEAPTELLKASAQYDSMSWTYLGIAVRLAQELGIDNTLLYELDVKDSKGDVPQSWHKERILRTWIYCYNADRHVSVRLGRNAVIQAYMSTAWWEKVTQRASVDVQRQGLNELWAERTLPQGLLAALMGTIQERLYPNKDVTRSIIRTGQWEAFIRSLDHELKSMVGKTRVVLKQNNVESTLLQIEIDYVRLYGNAIALRALQERLRRRVKANDLLFVTPSLLNLQEGPWIIDSLTAAQSILTHTINFLEGRGYLRLCPARIFQRILFACTFLFKALAVGVIEHGQSKTVRLLDQAIKALHNASVDPHHIPRGFAALLSLLQAQCRPALLAESGSIDPATKQQAQAQGQAQSSELNGASASASAQEQVPGTPAHAHQFAASTSRPLSTANGNGGGQQHSNEPLVGGSQVAAGASAVPSAYQSTHHFPSAGATGVATGSVNLDGVSTIATDNSYGFNPNPFEMPWEWSADAGTMDLGKEQDLLFQSLWQNHQNQDPGTGSNPLLNLFGTLVGDEFGLDG